jgi:FtsP/CotA-like multicopper oxidase with cupredoxin domain
MPVAGVLARPFGGLESLTPVRERKLYFSELRGNPNDPKSPIQYFITGDGAKPRIFDMNFKKPNITVYQGTVEDWIVENHAREAHAFHIHQLHLQLLERDGQKITEAMLRDTIDLPFWDGKGPYPSVKLRMDFRDPNITGIFVYHCHMLEHEDGGMVGAIEVVVPKH